MKSCSDDGLGIVTNRRQYCVSNHIINTLFIISITVNFCFFGTYLFNQQSNSSNRTIDRITTGHMLRQLKSDAKEPLTNIAHSHQLMSQKQINDLWNKFRVSDEYLQLRVDSLDVYNSIKDETGFDIDMKDYPRAPILLDFRDWTRKYNITRPDRLLVTGIVV